jgi:hypothetical protein
MISTGLQPHFLTISPPCAGLGILWSNPWGFESPLPHQPQITRFSSMVSRIRRDPCNVTMHHDSSRRITTRGVPRGTSWGTTHDTARGGPQAERIAKLESCVRLVGEGGSVPGRENAYSDGRVNLDSLRRTLRGCRVKGRRLGGNLR